MSQNNIRKNKTCLNCNFIVENKFCPNCGQENVEPRKSFSDLFFHFFEDLTHYENAFWKTIKNLLFKPAFLSKEYLSGKRLTYLAPIRLYIFISFITFFILAILPYENIEYTNNNEVINDTTTSNLHSKNINKKRNKEILTKHNSTSISTEKNLALEKENNDFLALFNYKSIHELDSLQKFGKNEKKLNDFEYWFEKKMITIKNNNTKQEFIEKSKESALHNFPKVIILYMPLFAFFLWLFHDKRKWFYFDHGIFTLHYFSFLLLIILITTLLNFIIKLITNSNFSDTCSSILSIIGYGWIFLYFFYAHYRFYGESKLTSIMKSIILFIINMFFIILFLALFVIITLISIH